MDKKLKIFLTGAGGFVGSNLQKALREDFDFICYDRKHIPSDVDVFVHAAGKAHDIKKVAQPEEYFQVNTQLTQTVFDSFLASRASVFIFLSSVKAVCDHFEGLLTEEVEPHPESIYGQSKLKAESYILSRTPGAEKRVYIFRPCMIHGPGNKGNLNLLYKFAKTGIPWPLGAYKNQRSFLSVDNLSFVIKAFILNNAIPSGVYNIADDEPLATSDILKLMADCDDSLKVRIWKLPKQFVELLSKVGALIKLPLNKDNVTKLTENFVVSNKKLKKYVPHLPLSSSEGLKYTIESFYKNA